MCRHVAALAVDILARSPALFEEATALTRALELFAVLDVVRHLLPFVRFSARCRQVMFCALLRCPDFACHASSRRIAR